MSFCCKIFDPLGFIAWLTTRNKVFLQTLWKELLKWDESFEFLKNGELREEWLKLVKQVHITVTGAAQDRRVITSDKYEIHHFSDASNQAYGAMTYLKILPCKEFPEGRISLVTAKGKVAPLKGKHTIPRLELAAAVVAAHQNKFVKKAWDIEDNVKQYMWIDAKSVLEWLSSYNLK